MVKTALTKQNLYLYHIVFKQVLNKTLEIVVLYLNQWMLDLSSSSHANDFIAICTRTLAIACLTRLIPSQLWSNGFTGLNCQKIKKKKWPIIKHSKQGCSISLLRPQRGPRISFGTKFRALRSKSAELVWKTYITLVNIWRTIFIMYVVQGPTQKPPVFQVINKQTKI